MKAGLASYLCENRNIGFNLKQIEKAMIRAQGKADLLCFPEAFLQGFDSLCWDYDVDSKIAVSQDSKEIGLLKEWTKKYGMALLTGYIEKDGDHIHSSCIVIDEGQIVHNYRRISKGWKESDRCDCHYCEGSEIREFGLRGRKFMIALCGDLWEDPSLFKTDGILLWPVFVSYSVETWETEEIGAYALQAASAADLTLMVNSIDPTCGSHGGSFFFEKGEVKDRIGFDEEGILYCIV